jgi:hypothetical protein
MARTLFLLLIVTSLIGCHSKPAPRPLQERLADAHGEDSYRRQTSLGADIHVEMDDGKVFDARITYDLKAGRCRMQLADNTILVWDGQRAWVSPPTAEPKDPKYHLTHWPFLITLPFHGKDPGTTFSGAEPMELAGAKYDTVKMTRPDGAWYRFFVDAESQWAKGLAYQTKQMERPAAITFYDFDRWEGMTLPREWKFWQWNPEVGLFGKPLGRARVYNIEFVTPKKDAFTPPPGARAID